MKFVPALSVPFSLFFLVGTLLGCASNEPPPSPSARGPLGLQTGAIQGGYDDAEDTAVVGVVRLGWQGAGICSGTLIAPNVVLTAQHCIAPIVGGPGNGGVDCNTSDFGGAYGANSIFVTTEQRLTQDPNAYHGAAQILIPPGAGVCGRDIALIVLKEPIPSSLAIPITPAVDTRLLAGELYSAVGYGNVGQDAGGSGERRRRDDLAVYCEGEACPFFQGSTEWVGQTGVCQGDSGGPALDLLGRVTGVASRGGFGCTSPVYGYVFGQGGWIRESVQSATFNSGVETPAWAFGWPTHPGFSYAMGKACTNGITCESGLCLNGYCSRMCSEQAPCPDGFACETVDAAAAPYPGSYCAAYPVGATCAQNEDCESGWCVDSICTRACYGGLTCPDGYGCDADTGLCKLLVVGEVCGEPADCLSGLCYDGQCTRQCDEVTACPAGYNCDPNDGLCLPVPMGEACDGPDECASGLCQDNVCTRECEADLQCPPGFRCGLDDGLCVPAAVGPECSADADCPGGLCQDGQCTRICDEQLSCPGGYQCASESGVCAAVAADASSSCQAGPSGAGGAGTLFCLFAVLMWMRRARRSMPIPLKR